MHGSGHLQGLNVSIRIQGTEYHSLIMVKWFSTRGYFFRNLSHNLFGISGGKYVYGCFFEGLCMTVFHEWIILVKV